LKVSWEKNGEKDEPVVVVLDDDWSELNVMSIFITRTFSLI
jgi:hypothetical protein